MSFICKIFFCGKFNESNSEFISPKIFKPINKFSLLISENFNVSSIEFSHKLNKPKITIKLPQKHNLFITKFEFIVVILG